MCVECHLLTEVPSVTMVVKNRAENLHQMLPEAYLYLGRDLCKVAENVWRGVYEPDTSVRVFQTYPRICGQ